MRVLISAILIFLFSDLNSQFSEATFDPARMKSKTISISQKYLTEVTPPFPIRNIEVIDGRFDTTVGYMRNSEFRDFYKVNLKSIDEIRTYFLSHIPVTATGDGHTVLCVVKKILLSNHIYLSENDKTGHVKNNYSVTSGALGKLEFFVSDENSFIPLYRFETTIAGDAGVSMAGPEYLGELLTAAIKKLETVPWATLKNKGKRFTRNAIDSSILNTFDLSLYKTPAKGVYKTFSDFINNKPLDIEYSIEKTGKADFLYVKDGKNRETLRTDFWGYCDGKDFFIYSAENFFKLHPTGKTFSVYGAKDYQTVRTLRLNFALIDVAMPNSAYSKSRTKSKYTLIHETLLLDMETGELF